MFFSEINFLYLAGGSEAGKWLYLFAGIGLPLVIANVGRWVWRSLKPVFGKASRHSRSSGR